MSFILKPGVLSKIIAEAYEEATAKQEASSNALYELVLRSSSSNQTKALPSASESPAE